MCGIAGALHFNGASAEKSNLVQRMTQAIAHRGPDGEGVWHSGPVSLGHRRLAIIDTSRAGLQPMTNESGTIWLTYNGEIYNFKEIKSVLEKKGYRFRSSTDTEVVIHAYEEWGVECLKYFNGMFAFGLWDERKKRLWLVRDRLGVKPLFYCQTPRRLLFGSEIKALLCDEEIQRDLDHEALSYYLALNYMPAPHTLLKNVRQLLPGHYMIVDADGRAETKEYWDLVYDETTNGSEKKYLEQFDALLEDSIRLRLVSDVPFGVFLSGGVDSSAVAWWMSQNMNEPVKSFTIGFGEKTFDELEYARAVADKVGASHHEKTVRADIAEILPKIVWHGEEPTADSSMVAVYRLAQMARENVTMVLSGDGADEILAGYETYQAYYMHKLCSKLPAWLWEKSLTALVNKLPMSDNKVSLDFKLKRFANGLRFNSEDAHATWRMIFDARARSKLLRPLSHSSGGKADVIDLYREVFARTNAAHPLNRMLYVDTRFYLPNDMLVKVDRMTMAHGLEAREPFLDYRLVEFLATVPPEFKLKRLRHKKYLLKKSMQDRLPKHVLWRKKQGFNVPNARWIQNELKPFVTDYLSPASLKRMGLIDAEFVDGLLKDHFERKADNSHQIWCLLTLVIWWRQFIARENFQ